jgi:serine/threonine-protein kinase
MNQEHWREIQLVFHLALEQPAREREAFVSERCGSDSELKSEVLMLLAADGADQGLLDGGIDLLAHELLGGEEGTVLPTETFGAYRITSVLGEGGMGVVYLAERADLGSRAAIKILRDAWLSPARRERFALEQRTLAQLRHPSIARLYDAGTRADGTPWFVMEYVEGVPLTDYCRSRASLVPERLKLFRAVCEAVLHAHRNLVVHRDLKPSNILVRADGSVALLDFGIAKQLEHIGDSAEQTRAGVRFLTPAYAAPEQVMGGAIGVHTDIYALGVVLYELLVGRLPFDLSNKTPSEAADLILEQGPERPSAAVRRMPLVGRGTSHILATRRSEWNDLDVLCLTAMHKDRERRYRSVEAIIRDTDHYLAREPLEARADSVGYRGGKFLRRNWRVLSASAAVFLVIVALVAFYTMRLTTANHVARAQVARTQRIQNFMFTLFQGGEEDVGPADSLRVVAIVDRGLQQARALDREPAVQAELYVTLGQIYEQLGNLPRADSLLRAALAQRRAIYGPNHPDVARSLVKLGVLRLGQAKYDDAERYVREGLAMSRKVLPRGDPFIGVATSALGRVMAERGDYTQAISVLEDARRLLASSGEANRPDFAVTLTLLANAHFYAGNYSAADSLNRAVLAIDKEIYGDRHPNVADDMINLAAVQFELGRFGQAEQYNRAAHDIFLGWYGRDNAETASSLVLLSRDLLSQKRTTEAAPLLREALAIYEKVYGPVHPRIASTLNELGRLAQQEGRLEEAKSDFRRMADIYRTVYDDKHYLIGIALSNLAGVFQADGDYGQAERLFRETLMRYADELEPEHPLVGIAHARLARSLLGERRYAEAAREGEAGYKILVNQTEPQKVWLDYSRKTLSAAYDSLGRADEAARWLEDTAAGARLEPPNK